MEIYIIEDNIRREFFVTTDENGAYITQFEPLSNEAGHYIVGASFPGQGLTTAQDEFDILGVEFDNADFIVWDVLLNQAESRTIAIRNMSSVALNNVNIEADLPEGVSLVFDEIPMLNGNETVDINYTLIGSEVSPIGRYQEIELVISSDENATNEETAYYFCKAQEGYINADIASINRTISQEQSNFLEITVVNNGEGETGDILIDIPAVDFINLVSLQTVPSINSGDTTLVILEFIPTASLPLNTPATGTIVLNASNGNHIAIPYKVEKVSEEKGGIIIDVVDEYTYFTEEAPHVENAKVRISHYFTGEVFAEGYTNADGIFTVDSLPEGQLRLTVQAEQHQAYDNVIHILPGMEITETIFLSYQAISFTWDVVPTVIEDVYEIDLVIEFETNVPKPVVTIEVPDTMPQLFGSETFSFFVTLTNHGLITAQEVELNFPTSDVEYEWNTNYVPADLLAQQSVQIPVVMQRISNADGSRADESDTDDTRDNTSIVDMNDISSFNKSSGGGACVNLVELYFTYPCAGYDLSGSGGESFNMDGRDCSSNTPSGSGPCNGCSPNPPGGVPGGVSGPGSFNNIPQISVFVDCNDEPEPDDPPDPDDPNDGPEPEDLIGCATSAALTVAGCSGPGQIARLSICGLGIISSAVNPGDNPHESVANVGLSLLGCALSGAFGCGFSIGTTLGGCINAIFGARANGLSQKSMIIEDAAVDMHQALLALDAKDAWLLEFYGPLMYNLSLIHI